VQSDSSDPAENWLSALRDAGSVELGPVGYAAVRTRGYAAFAALSADRALLQRHRSDVEAMCRSGNAPARLYAALLLRTLDPDQGERALRALLQARESLELWPGGCARLPVATLGEAAAWLLGSRP